jgi:putative transposase
MKKKRTARPSLEELVPDAAKRNEMLSRLYQGDSILGEGGIFTEMLQAFVNAALEGEINHHLKHGETGSSDNRRNGHTDKVVRSPAGPLAIRTPRDREGAHSPKAWMR